MHLWSLKHTPSIAVSGKSVILTFSSLQIKFVFSCLNSWFSGRNGSFEVRWVNLTCLCPTPWVDTWICYCSYSSICWKFSVNIQLQLSVLVFYYFIRSPLFFLSYCLIGLCNWLPLCLLEMKQLHWIPLLLLLSELCFYT